MTDDDWERLVDRIRNSPPPMRLYGWWWRTPADIRAQCAMSTVIDTHGPRLPVIETEDAKREKEQMLARLHRPRSW